MDVAGLHAPARTLRTSTPPEAPALIALRDENDTLRARIKRKRPVVTLPGCNSTASARLAC